jgi:hypothetical protein
MELQVLLPVDTLLVEVVDQIDYYLPRELEDRVVVEMDLQVFLQEQQILEEVVEHLLLPMELAVQVPVVPESF